MDFAALPILLALPFLLAVSTFCSTSETALFSLDYHDRMRLARTAPRAAAIVTDLLARPRELLVSIIFTNILVNTLFMVFTSMLLLAAPSPLVGIAINIFNLLLLTLIGEVVCKMLAARRRVEIARLVAVPVLLITRALGPLRVFLDRGVIAPLTRLFVPDRSDDRVALTQEELAALLRAGASAGVLDRGESRVLREVLNLGNLRVRDLMTPRADLEFLDADSSAADAVDLARRTRLTRVPVVKGGLDGDCVGFLDMKAFLVAHARARPAPSLAAFTTPPAFVPASARVDLLLEQFRQRGLKVALCVDEFGATVGVITLRDIVRELTRELEAETRISGPRTPTAIAPGTPLTADDEPVQQPDGAWSVPGRFPAHDLADMFGLAADRRVSTVAGLVFARLGRVPVAGDTVRIGNLSARVESVEGRVAQRVTIRVATDSLAAAPTGARTEGAP